MLEHSQRRSRQTQIILLVGVAIAIAYWSGEGLLRLFVLETGGFRDALLPSNAHELWMRSLLACVIIGFAVYCQLLVNKLYESTRRYKALFENAPDAVFIADSESGVITDANPAASQLLLRSHDEIVGLHQSELHPPVKRDDSTRIFIAQVEESKKGKGSRPIEEVVLRSDGVEVPVEVVAETVNIGGRTVLQGIFRDVTDRKRVEQELSYERDLLRTLLDNIPDYIYFKDRERKFVRVSSSFCDLFGRPMEDIVGKTDDEFLPSVAAKTVAHDDRQVMETAMPIVDKEQTGTIREEEHLVSTTKLPWRDAEGRIIGLFGVSRDIAPRKKAENALKASEEKYRTLSANIPGMVFRGKADWSVDFISNSDGICGYLPEDFYDQRVNWLDLVHPDDKEEVKKVAGQLAMASGNTVEEYRITTKNGDVRWVEDHKTPRFTEEGVFIGVDGVVFDITRRKEAEEELRKFRMIADRAGYGVAVADLDGNLLYGNKSFADMHGLKAIELVGKNLSLLHNEEQMPRVNELNILLKEEGRYVAEEVWHKRADDTVFPALMNATVVKNEKGEPVFLAATAIDITEQKQAEEKLEMYRSEMAKTERLASLGTLSAIAAHEITQPLTVIQLSLQNAMDELESISCPDTIRSKLQHSLDEVFVITSIIEKFRGFARRSSHPTIGKVDLQTVAERTTELLSGASKRKRVTLQIQGMEGLPHVHSDEKDLEQLFFALIDNAIREGNDQQNRQVVISGAVIDDHIELKFSDNCGGIAPENLDRVFEPFFTTKPESEGTGLGLCVVQDIVTRVCGKIRVESTFGEGSTFVVTLPIHR